MSRQSQERRRDLIKDLAQQGLDLPTFWQEAAAAFAPEVPHYLTPCWFTLDPESLLVTSHYDHGMIPHLPQEWLAQEYYEDDFNKLSDVARLEGGLSTIHQVTGGDPSRSARWELFVRPFGGDQELLAALKTRGGDVWGILALYREPGQAEFDDAELEFLSEVSPYFAEGARNALLVAGATEPEGEDRPGLLVIGEDWALESLTPGSEQLVSELMGSGQSVGGMPPAVLALAGRVLRPADDGSQDDDASVARVRSSEGRWFVLHGAPLMISGSRRVAIIIQPAQPARLSELLMAAHGLTPREQEVTRLVLCGASTNEIADALFLSAHTVQQHLKRIFDKTGVRSRRELVGQVFFAHFEPRLRDNEARVINGQPLRGGPRVPVHASSARPKPS